LENPQLAHPIVASICLDHSAKRLFLADFALFLFFLNSFRNQDLCHSIFDASSVQDWHLLCSVPAPVEPKRLFSVPTPPGKVIGVSLADAPVRSKACAKKLIADSSPPSGPHSTTKDAFPQFEVGQACR
jgi:hypothetical protein